MRNEVSESATSITSPSRPAPCSITSLVINLGCYFFKDLSGLSCTFASFQGQWNMNKSQHSDHENESLAMLILTLIWSMNQCKFKMYENLEMCLCSIK